MLKSGPHLTFVKQDKSLWVFYAADRKSEQYKTIKILDDIKIPDIPLRQVTEFTPPEKDGEIPTEPPTVPGGGTGNGGIGNGGGGNGGGNQNPGGGQVNLPPYDGSLPFGGTPAAADDWVYYSSNGIHKVKPDGTLLVPITPNSRIGGMQIINDMIYYTDRGFTTTNLKRIKTDGTGGIDIVAGISNWYVSGEWVYFSFSSWSAEQIKPYRIPIIGGTEEKINDRVLISPIIEAGGWLYFMQNPAPADIYGNIIAENASFVRMRPDGSQLTEFDKREGRSNGARNLIVIGDWIFYLCRDHGDEDGYAVYRMRIDGSHKEVIDDGKSWFLVNYGEWLFYGSSRNGIWKMKTDGSAKEQIYSGQCYTFNSNIAGDLLYFADAQNMYKMRHDGSQLEIIISDADDITNIWVSRR